MEAGKSVTHHSSYFDVVYTINSLGFRDKPRGVHKDENVYRILLYGDSQIFGWGVSEGERFSNLIESQRRYLEIWNLAVPGYGLDQQILSYKRDGKSLNADEITFFVSGNTLERTRHDYIYKKYKPMFMTDQRGDLKLIPIPKGKIAITSFFYKTPMTSLPYKILSRMYLPYFIELRLVILKDILKKFSYNRNEAEADSLIQPERLSGFEKEVLITSKDIALGRGQRITILAELPKAKRKDLKDFCDQNGIGFLEIVFDDNKGQDFIFGRYDAHWNPQAHKLAAKQLLSQAGKNIER